MVADIKEQAEILWRVYREACSSDDDLMIRSARNDLVIWYSAYTNSLVQRIARKMLYRLNLNHDCLFDLINDSLLGYERKEGLIYAIEHYTNVDGTWPFEAFAYNYVLHAILHGETVINGNKPYQIRQAQQYRKILAQFVTQYHREPTTTELSNFSGISVKMLKKMWHAWEFLNPDSLDQKIKLEGDDEELEREIADPDVLTPEERFNETEKKLRIIILTYLLEYPDNDTGGNQVILKIIQGSKLSKIELTILILSYKYNLSHDEIAAKLKISSNYSRKILSTAIAKLRKYFSK